MPYFVCLKCRATFGGWGVGKYCDKCKGKLKEISEEELDKIIKKEKRRD